MILRSQDIQEIEAALTALELTDKWGDSMIGMMAVPPVANFHGAEWEKTQDDFENGVIDCAEFARRQIEMILEYSSYRYRLQLEKRLTDIFSHRIQGETA